MERKRHHRTLLAVINGMSVAEAKRNNQLKVLQPTQNFANAKQHSMFVQDDDDDDDQGDNDLTGDNSEANAPAQSFLIPAASVFSPHGHFAVQAATQPKTTEPGWMTNFGQARSPDLLSSGGPPKGLFAPKPQESKPLLSSHTSAEISTSLPQTNNSGQPQSPLSLPATTIGASSGFTGFTATPSLAFNQGSTFSNQATPVTIQAEQREPTLLPHPSLGVQQQASAETAPKSLFNLPSLTSVASTPEPSHSVRSGFGTLQSPTAPTQIICE